MPLLKNSSNARVINVSSKSYMLGEINFEDIHLRNRASPPISYAQSKLAINLFTRQLAKLLGLYSNVKTYSLHPGTIHSDICRYMLIKKALVQIIPKLGFTLDVEMGAQTTLFCALEESIENESGSYYE